MEKDPEIEDQALMKRPDLSFCINDGAVLVQPDPTTPGSPAGPSDRGHAKTK